MDRKILKYEILNLGIEPNRIANLEQKIELIMEKYYSRDIPFNPYLNSKNQLMRLLIEGNFPTVREWNIFAKKEGYLSHVSIEYISALNWKAFYQYLLQEIRDLLLDDIPL